MDFWPDNSVVVTGGGGFLGTYVVKKLKERGCRAVHIPRQKEFDFTDLNAIHRMYDRMKPDIVIHLAAICGGIGANLKHPADFFYKNLIMGVQLMELARQRGVRKFVAIGTICAYPKFTPVPFKEENLWDGYPEETNAPYGLAKKMLLVQAQTYRQQYGFNAIYLLPVNLYGPGDNFDPETSHVIPALIRRFIEARDKGLPSVTCWGSGRVSREFLYVEDAAEAIVLAAERYNGSAPVNIGAAFEIQIYELAEQIKQLTGYKGEIKWDTSKPDGQPHRKLDTSKAKDFFGFEAKMGFMEGLQKTIDWYNHTRTLNTVPL